MSIPLHPTRGLDPHICICPRCGEDNGELTIGVTYTGTDEHGRRHYFSRGKRRVEERQHNVTITDVSEVEENEKIPTSLCEKCKNELKAEKVAVQGGGVYFRCDECGLQGVVKNRESSAAFCKQVREANNVPFLPDSLDNAPAGIAFETCEHHNNIGITDGKQKTPAETEVPSEKAVPPDAAKH